MCGIAGAMSLDGSRISGLKRRLDTMSRLQEHRGPDGSDFWTDEKETIGLSHQRLAIIDLTDQGRQPMASDSGSVLVFNGEIYNYSEIRQKYEKVFRFRSASDSEAILAAYDSRGIDSVSQLEGMFAYAIWDPKIRKLFLARDRFGIKPLYFMQCEGVFYFSSEMKALLPFLQTVKTNNVALSRYFFFQNQGNGETLFEGIYELGPGEALTVESDGSIKRSTYWKMGAGEGWHQSEKKAVDKTKDLVTRSVRSHLVSDVKLGAYVSGGVDSSLVHALASELSGLPLPAFHGRFPGHPDFDESSFAQSAASRTNSSIHITEIFADDFVEVMPELVWAMDTPVAGPGAFPQFMVSKSASRHVKVVLGGQGGDEVFGGYARYLIAQLSATIWGAVHPGANKFESMPLSSLPQLVPRLRGYGPLLEKSLSKGGPVSGSERYFQILDRSSDFAGIVSPAFLDSSQIREEFEETFFSGASGRSYLQHMLDFDLKTSLPGLLHVEDRVSMAHGIESRVPLLDHRLVEFASSIPDSIKMKDAEPKRLLKKAFKNVLPQNILRRQDKMGFPVPLHSWMKSGPVREFVLDTLQSESAKSRPYLEDSGQLSLEVESGSFSRRDWALLNLELWQSEFHDKHHLGKFVS